MAKKKRRAGRAGAAQRDARKPKPTGTPASSEATIRPENVAVGPWPRWLRVAFVVLGAGYAASVALGGMGWNRTELPGPVRFFTETSCLFPRAGTMAIEYRAEGYLCTGKRWVPIDVRPDFPIHAENKESGFHRAMYFFRREARVMHALDDYLVARNMARGKELGGVRLSSIRIPFPELGGDVERFRYRPIDEYPPKWHKAWYRTPQRRVKERCGSAATSGPDEPERAPRGSDSTEDEGGEP